MKALLVRQEGRDSLMLSQFEALGNQSLEKKRTWTEWILRSPG
jgi:hypothetical protein